MIDYTSEPDFDPTQIDSYPIRIHQQDDSTVPEVPSRSRESDSRDCIDRDSRLFAEGGPRFEVEGLDKEAFFRENFPAIQQIVDAVNVRFQLGETIALSAVEVLAVCNAEMGLKEDGTVDPKHDHQAGEYGLLPLSTIHRAVTGSDAPDPFGLYRPEINFEEFLLYLGGLKVFGPYRPIYAYPGIPGQVRRQAQTAAAVVHGYFYSPNYRPKSSKPSNGNILSVIASDHNLGNYMKTTTFRAAWSIPARMDNLEQGMDLATRLLEGEMDGANSPGQLVPSGADPDRLDVSPGEGAELADPESDGQEETFYDADDYIPEIFESEEFQLESRGKAVSWVSDDRSPCYHHLLGQDSGAIAEGQLFEIGRDEFSLLIEANGFDPKGKNNVIAFGIRGAILAKGDKEEDVEKFILEVARPDHHHYRCLVGYFFQDRGTFSVFTGSTVPWHGYMEKNLTNNLLPTGCYVYKTGAHRPSDRSRWVDPALRMSNGDLVESGPATVVRNRDNLIFDTSDFWDRCAPGDNIHCAYSDTTFSSLGCQTVKGGIHSGLWTDFQRTLKGLPKNARVDYVLLTGADFALAASAVSSGQGLGHDQTVRRLVRLRGGSLGVEVERLQSRLGIGVDGHFGSGTRKRLTEFQEENDLPVDGIYSPALDEQLGWNVFARAEANAIGGEMVRPAIPLPLPGVQPPAIWRSRGQTGEGLPPFGEICSRFIEGELTEAEMAEFFVEGRPADDQFGPNLQLDPDQVGLPETTRGTQGVLLLANSICNRRRRVLYRKKLKENPGAIRILAEGDSWFQYPLKLKDIIDHLMDDPNIAVRCYSAAGDVLSNMVENPEFLDAIQYEDPDYFLLSGGGNDLIAGDGLRRLLHPYDPEKAPRDYFNDAYFDYLSEVEFLYREVLSLIHGESPRVKVICHGYDYAIPNDGTWLGNPMNELGIENKDLQFQIMRAVVDDINGVIGRAAGQWDGGETSVLDLRGIIPSDGWYDEFHPTSEHYASLAERYRGVIG